jgi:ubiquinol-cytochrome c reductase cytochrome b subunit
MRTGPSKMISYLLPRFGMSALIICLASGIALAFQYQPAGNVFRNMEEITTVIPFGWLFRKVHYASGQLFVAFMLLHTVDHFLRKRYRNYTLKTWALLVVPLGLCFFELFTGFILKGDKEGIFAGQIFMNILKGVPLVGFVFSKLFIVPGKDFFLLPYVYHCLLLPALIIYLIRSHIKPWFQDKKTFFGGVLFFLVYAVVVPQPMDIPPEADIQMIQSPWFFLGIQTLLKTVNPVLAGIVLPGILFLCLLFLPLCGKIHRPDGVAQNVPSIGCNLLHYFMMISFGLYALLCVRAAIWGI